VDEKSDEIREVVVVGGGPVGALLAGLLGRDGLCTLLFEREREIHPLPRAVHFDHEIARILQSVGLPPDGLPDTAPIEGCEFWSAGRELLFRLPLEQGVTDQGWRRDTMFHQPALEAALRDAAARQGSVSLRLGHEVTELEEQGDHVALGVRDRASGATRRVRARFVVGCDGAGSFVRKRAGLPLDDLAFDEPWLVVDARTSKPPAELGLPVPLVQLCDPARPVTFVPVAGPWIRWEFMLLPGETREEMLRPERVAELISAWTDPRHVEVVRTAVYDFHALVAKRWGTRRIFLAGDAAHQTPPFLGQGLCAGLRDAANLAWKLRLVLRGAASEAILASYQSEREPHVRALIGVAIAMGRIICTLDPAVAATRDAQFLARSERAIPVPPLPRLGPGLFQPGSPAAGSLGLQARVRGRDGRPALLDDALGPGFALLARAPAAAADGEAALSTAARRVLGSISGHLVAIEPAFDVDGAYAAWLDRLGCDAALVRPDHVVFGTASGPDAASALLEALGERLGASPRAAPEAGAEPPDSAV
jgi:3-(3-hydroxy-phenyl)propionate hydroxylase